MGTSNTSLGRPFELPGERELRGFFAPEYETYQDAIGGLEPGPSG